MEEGLQVDVIYTDFVKAFDRVNFTVLRKKLSAFGIHSSLLNWICSYLTGRLQCVRIECYESRNFLVLSGVPQGSHLGPLLFIIYINDVAELFSFAQCLLYADDLKLFVAINNLSDCLRLQAEFNNFIKWCNENGLKLNPNKCKCFSFHRLQQPLLFNYSILDFIINRPSDVCDLGVVFDKKLSGSLHIDYISARASKMLGFLKRNSVDFHDPHTLKSLFISLVRSILEYACVVWSPYTAQDIGRIEAFQKSFTRFALRRLRWDNGLPSYSARCRLLDLQSLESRRRIAGIMFIRDILCYRINSPELVGLLNIYAPCTVLRRRDFLSVPVHRTTYGQHEPITYCSRIFNDAYKFLDFADTREEFKSNVCHLFINI